MAAGMQKKKAAPDAWAPWLLLPLAAAVALAACFLAGSGFFPQPWQKQDAASIEIVLDAPFPVEGANLTASAFSSCGSFSLYLDGNRIADGQARADATFVAKAGAHRLEARSEGCSSSLDFSSRERECEDGAVKNCSIGGCGGLQECANGAYGGCVLRKRACAEGDAVGCNLDGCQFGYSTCNNCGQFGPCAPKPGNGSC